jgi:hypothetical protein
MGPDRRHPNLGYVAAGLPLLATIWDDVNDWRDA